MYIKALEQEVLRLKETFAIATKERNAVEEENRRLKALLAQHGISYDFGNTPIKFQRENSGMSGFGASQSSGSISGSYGRPDSGSNSTGFSPPMNPGSLAQSQMQGIPQQQERNLAQLPASGLDYDQIGIDFVLTYDSQGNPIHLPARGPYPSPPPQR